MGGLPAECGVASVVVVGVEEVWQGCASFGVAGVGAEVGPFVEQGAVEAFDLAVGLRPVGAGEFAGRAEFGQGLAPGDALAVGPGVVGQHALDPGDAEGGEEGRCPAQEVCAGGGLLVGVDLAVGEAGVVVDCGVDVVEAHAASGGPAGLAAQDPMAAAVRDPAEFLDVDVDQFAGPVAFVAADDLSGGPVHERQAVQARAGPGYGAPSRLACPGSGRSWLDRACGCGAVRQTCASNRRRGAFSGVVRGAAGAVV